MYLMCKIELAPKIQEWGHHFDNGNFEKLDLDGIPDEYILFRFENPKISHPEIPLLQLNSQKSVQLVGGLRLGFRTFLNSYLPEVEVVNGTGNENVFIQFKHREGKIYLKKKHPTNYWLLPPDIILDSDFNIKIESENTGSYDIAYNITTAENSTFLANADLPIRDSFGNVVKGSQSKYAVGNRPLGINKLLLYPYSMDFTSIFEDLACTFPNEEYIENEGNILLSLITLKTTMSTEDFYKAFELLHDNKYGAMQEESALNYSKIKKSSLNFYDYLGFIDYDYESKKLIITPSEVIFVPTNKGREVLLTGARDKAFVTSLLSKAQQLRLSVQIFNQHLYNQHLLLPDCIRIKAYGKATEGYGVKQLEELAKELKIGFDKDTIPQAGLLELSSTLAEYEGDLLQNNEVKQEDYDWARRVFNIDTFAFEKNESLDASFSLVEYKLNEYTVTYRLWNKGKCYKIDRNWGKYLALKHHKKQAILFDSNNNRLAIPVELPIPRLLAKSIFLLSGIAPVYSGIMFEGRRIGYRVYQNIPSIFIKNLFHKLNQKVIPTTLNSY